MTVLELDENNNFIEWPFSKKDDDFIEKFKNSFISAENRMSNKELSHWEISLIWHTVFSNFQPYKTPNIACSDIDESQKQLYFKGIEYGFMKNMDVYNEKWSDEYEQYLKNKGNNHEKTKIR